MALESSGDRPFSIGFIHVSRQRDRWNLPVGVCTQRSHLLNQPIAVFFGVADSGDAPMPESSEILFRISQNHPAIQQRLFFWHTNIANQHVVPIGMVIQSS